MPFSETSRAPAPSCAVLVSSCDAYADLWPPFFHLWRRHWPDCPFPVYLGSGEADPRLPGVTALRSTGGRDWSRCLLEHLEQVPAEHVLLTLDDFFLRRRVDTAAVQEALAFAVSRRAVQVRLNPRPSPRRSDPTDGPCRELPPGTPLRFALQAAIFHRESLGRLLRAGESIWESEGNGNGRAAALPGGFYTVRRAVLPYEGWLTHHVIEKGRWFPHERLRYAWAGIGCDFSRRGTLPLLDALLYQSAMVAHGFVNLLPPRARARTGACLKAAAARLFPGRVRRMGGKA